MKKGALLYALRIKEEVVIEGLRDRKNPHFPHYSLYPKSQWNYGLCVEQKEDFTFIDGRCDKEPWRGSQNGLSLRVRMREIRDFKLQYVEQVQSREKPREECKWEARKAVFTPKVLPVKTDELGEECTVTLVPYGTTRLRIAIFPIVK